MIPPLSVGRGKEEVLPGIMIDLVPTSILITVQGEPVPKGRPRARIVSPRNGKPFIVFYSPSETTTYEEAIQWVAKGKMGGKPPLECPCEVIIRAYFSIPPSWTAKKTQAALHGTLRHVSKPDLDNVEKLVLDAMNKVVFKDDSCVWKKYSEKHYSRNPRLEIEVKETVPTILTN